jgi:PiT family inorganic phosphate transporter
MDLAILIFFSSGLFLGFSLGANDSANVFGTAVASRMIRFGTAAVLASVFILLGAVISGAGAAHGLGELGAVNALPGAFTVALCAAITVYLMTKSGLPVSTTQAIVGAIVGWNLFSGSVTDLAVLGKIAGTWIAAPVLGAITAMILYAGVRRLVRAGRIHLLALDNYTRWGLIVAGILGSYSLGANNIGNVMGVFISSSPFTDFQVGALTITGIQQLFFVGAIAIAVGVITFSKPVMMTVGRGILPLTPIAAFVTVVAHAVVLFLFSSVSLQHSLVSNGLPPIPLIPVSSSQAIVGAVIGIASLDGMRGLRQIRWQQVGGIVAGWAATPVLAGLLCVLSLFIMQNVFSQTVFVPVEYELRTSELSRLKALGVPVESLEPMAGRRIASGEVFMYQVGKRATLDPEQQKLVLGSAEIADLAIVPEALAEIDVDYLGGERADALRALVGRSFDRRWKLEDALVEQGPAWQPREATPLNQLYNKERRSHLSYVYETFTVQPEEEEAWLE